MRSYLCVALSVLVLAADHILASDTPSDTAGTHPLTYSLKVSKEIITERHSTNISGEPGPSARNNTIAVFVAFNDAKTSYIPPFTYDNSNLEWQRFSGSLPNEAVGIWNGYTKRYDYVCRTVDSCETGFYHSGYGDSCFYAHYPDLRYTSGFYILVNKDGFENLQWKSESYGSVPANSVKPCTSAKGYVGKNWYGLGLVHAGDSFYLPWLSSHKNGRFYGYTTWYRQSYQVLTINTDEFSQVIQDVKYDIDNSNYIDAPPFAVDEHTVVNKRCESAMFSATLSATQTETHTWQFGYSMNLGISTTFTVGLPTIVGTSITIGLELSFQLTKGFHISQSQTTSLHVQTNVPPNVKCPLKMQGRKYTLNIPFTARLGRTYSSGETKWTTIYGTYEGVQVSNYDAIIERCERLAYPLLCPDKVHVSDMSSSCQKASAESMQCQLPVH